ncbi:MAG: FHA domain-containing protein [Gammaproteobacteria bacterium]|jgi:predicted component of type VI protein secretion system|nr:FHA domain-containing protein [Gammaproteobacteria bacterium]
MAYLRIFMGDTLLEQRELSADRITIGRTGDNDVVLNSQGVSKHHATIERRGESFVLIDNGSANGVFVGGRRIRRHKLKYWDDIQVYDFVLKFMAAARLRGEEAGVPNWSLERAQQEATMEVDISSLGDLAKLRKRIRVPSVELFGDGDAPTRYALDKVNFVIGRSPECDLNTPGWLAPRLAARIQRRNDGCYLLPGRRGRVSVNGRRVWRPVMLNDADDLKVRGLQLKFFFRPIESA